MLKKIAGVFLAFGLAGMGWAQSIDLNKATEVTLDGLKGVGPALTKEVMREREKAPFKDWDDVTHRVKGMGPKKANSLSEQGVRVHGNAYERKAANHQPAIDAGKDGSKAAAQSANATAGKAAPTNN